MDPTIGLAVGRGTGPELANVFERVLNTLGKASSTTIRIVRSPRLYHSYFSLKAEGSGFAEIADLTRQDADHYERFCRARALAGTTAVFRTAINAQSLYLVRERLQAVKTDLIEDRDSSLLMVRDEAQGFYTGENSHSPGVVHRTMKFSKEITAKVVAAALEQARRQWPGEQVERVVMAYKFHLLDGALGGWVEEIAARHGVEIALAQPDTVNRNLIEHGLPRRTVIIGANEWADIMHVVLLDRLGSERQENRYTENIHLHPDVAGLVEYQTVHGSADDLAGLGIVNPVATIRAAAAIAERHAGCAGAIKSTEDALESVGRQGITTPDLGGPHSTTEVTEAVVDLLKQPGRSADVLSAVEG
ncbi:isocitrate/isopropylmalate family dehydrogenase [Amycolatopsis sp. BJA-103]|uniref:isocitrate/isopropylmalate family dehydrogenase n=1 Tax=unclassified Amycolatopsis TaxID=2618356 RepID=UPI000C7627DF|nr:isocitrate/isopropylmalate family dehydrogenase [Amycolatopsis sp. BJA-103]AUI60285.1 isocitrate dehydrogenase [Amycolatopsis sp. BJA-103]PNE16310.1 isocitrate dehydrogenase [Amycolatopsis sp. BJA-103]